MALETDRTPDRKRETVMLRHSSLKAAALAAMLAYVIGAPPAHPQGAAVLSGQVTSAEEGAMEGVLVNARKDGSTVTVSVVTNEQGRYSFPAGRLEAGHYALSTRSTGYDLEGPNAADLASGTPAVVDLKLRKTRNLSKQLTNAEWMMSIPGSDDDKLQLLNCVSCHTLERIMKSSHDADEFVQVVTRMQGYAQVSHQSGAVPKVRAVPGHDQSQPGSALGIRAQDPAARERPRHPCGHYRVRPAAADDRAP
jgi:virginiamycin B lyase